MLFGPPQEALSNTGLCCLVWDEAARSIKIRATSEPAASVNLEYLMLALKAQHRDDRTSAKHWSNTEFGTSLHQPFFAGTKTSCCDSFAVAFCKAVCQQLSDGITSL